MAVNLSKRCKHYLRRDFTAVHEVPFDGCANPGRCNPAAHGNISRYETCSKGHERKLNINQGFIEVGPWH